MLTGYYLIDSFTVLKCLFSNVGCENVQGIRRKDKVRHIILAYDAFVVITLYDVHLSNKTHIAL